MSLTRYQPLIEFGVLLGIVLLVLVLVVKPALTYQPVKYKNIDVIDVDPFPTPVYFTIKRELGDWCKILLPIIGFVLGRMRKK